MKLKEKKSYDKNVELIELYRGGDRAAGEELALLNKPLVYKIAGRFVGRGVELEELVELGTIGLVKAINTFEPERECAFSTYAVPLIFGEIRRFLRDDGMIKVSRESKRLCALLNAERERRLNEGLRADVRSIAEAVGVCAEDAAAALFATAPVRSLDEALYDDDERETLASSVFDSEAEERSFNSIAIRMAIEKLPELERRIIILRYFRDKSQAETAALLGLTQVKISRLEKRILLSLREQLT